jgi:hypothetical protein
MESQPIMPPLLTTAIHTRRTDAETLTMCRKMYGDAATLDALVAANGNAREANRTLRRELQRSLRAAKRAKRHATRTNDVIYNGPVFIGPTLRSLIDAGREVKCEMGGGKRIRATFAGALTGLPDSDSGNHIVLYDARRIGAGESTAEILWTGQDYRVHIRRRSSLDTRQVITLDIAEAA